ncbi:hypothetical protein, partial [Methylophaga sp. UBA5088]|uniref:hypothetical protein n=1 Tax=Methylophaga sp. UBA5088 TaxID=1946898 RepID=UPI00259D1E0C
MADVEPELSESSESSADIEIDNIAEEPITTEEQNSEPELSEDELSLEPIDNDEAPAIDEPQLETEAETPELAEDNEPEV